MVKEITHEGKEYFQCSICEFYYGLKKFAKKCEDFCEKHKSCSLDITKHAVKVKQ